MKDYKPKQISNDYDRLEELLRAGEKVICFFDYFKYTASALIFTINLGGEYHAIDWISRDRIFGGCIYNESEFWKSINLQFIDKEVLNGRD